MSVRVKICGLRREADVRAAVEAGADYLGFVFAPKSPRRADVSELRSWLDEARDLAEVVGVFQDQSETEVLEVVESLDLDFVQLHGDEQGAVWQRLPVRLIEARRVTDEGIAPPRFAGAAWAHLVDPGGGSGRSFDWQRAEEIARSHRLFLAGGLTPQNVGDAVRAARPFAVDVASGVETEPGVKDERLVREFIHAAKEATLA